MTRFFFKMAIQISQVIIYQKYTKLSVSGENTEKPEKLELCECIYYKNQ